MAALLVATDLWVDVTRLLTVMALATATYRARYRKDEHGALSFGFALFGWTGFALVVDSMARWNPLAPTNSIVGLLPMSVLRPFMSASELGESIKRGTLVGPWGNRYRILHYLLVLIVAFLGAILCWMAERKRGAPHDERVWPAGVWRASNQVGGN